MRNKLKHFLAFSLAGFLGFSLFWSTPLPASKATTIDYQAEMESRKNLSVESNQIPNWPEGPSIGAEAAILMDAETGAILYAKNIHEQLYPASVTKILTTLIAVENAKLDEMVNFSKEAVFSIPVGSSSIAMDVGESITVDQCLQAILIASANEVSNALGEHIAGSMEAYVQMMNDKAKELGCLNSNFVTINGLHDDNHYTTAYDLATIGRHFFANELLCRYASSSKLEIPATSTQPDNIVEWSKNQLLKGRSHAYEYLVASKTGYTEKARQTLISCAQKDGMKLICVVLKEESPFQFSDTVDLFNYGFSNFTKVNISQSEKRFDINNSSFFYSNNDIFGNSRPFISLNQEDSVIIPNTLTFENLTSEINYDLPPSGSIATINYTYEGNFVGSATIDLTTQNHVSYEFDGEMASTNLEDEKGTVEDKLIFVNVKKVLFWILGIALVAIIVIVGISLYRNYHFDNYRRSKKRRKKRREYKRSPRY